MFRSLRIGFATNSSSSHSVIFHPGQGSKLLSGIDETPILTMSPSNTYCFTTAHDKALFILASDRDHWTSNHQRLRAAKVLAKHGLPADLFNTAMTFDLPVESAGIENLYYLEESGIEACDWLDLMLSDQIVMYGHYDGSENPCRGVLLDGYGVTIGPGDSWRKDGDAIVGFSHKTGTKVRWSPTPYEKAGTPELVDMKITNFCAYGCSFCYMDSTKDGQHAPLSRIIDYFDQMKDLGLFELALGGGEPAHHPEFAQILQAATERGITCNFTAFGLDWIKNKDIMLAIEAARGCGIGLSIHTAKDITKVERARQALREARIYSAQVMGQTVIGGSTFTSVEQMLDKSIAHRVPLLLLGYKETGRGIGYNRRSVSRERMMGLLTKARRAIENANEYENGFQLSVDTSFLDQHGDLLDEMGVPVILRSSPEGKFSMFVDAVMGLCGPSSYCDESQMEPVKNIRAQFAKW
jgi:hypothetical protein